MTAPTSNAVRSLIVVSRDHAELSLAMAFARGQDFASRAIILLPDDLYARHKDSLPVDTLRFGGPEDILSAADRHQPDLVLLFSGYLFSVDGTLSTDLTNRLLRQLRDRRCSIATSDPFLGLLPELTFAQIDARMLAPGHAAWRRWLTRLAVRLRRRVSDVPELDDATHLHPLAIPRHDDGISRLAFFNPASVQTAGGSPEAPPSWLFTLSRIDLDCQVLLLGLRGFIEILLGMLRYAAEAARPTLIAPPSIVKYLAGALPAPIELLPGCPYPEFERRLLDAEYAFTWNPFSFSMLPRLVNGLPVFPFDRGYFSRTIKPFHAAARDCYFGGWEPTYLDQRQLFSPYVLAHLAKEQQLAIQSLRERWQSSPTPDEVVARLAGAGSRPAPAQGP